MMKMRPLNYVKISALSGISAGLTKRCVGKLYSQSYGLELCTFIQSVGHGVDYRNNIHKRSQSQDYPIAMFHLGLG